ncbi:PepSY-associated TM helix domain-containing protein [Arenibacter certesii]|uniref:Iron transporter n=1 Tax=Arenibacter certesii TaxID=228955 RepID=A0A918J4G1_9FLAO|nr:PepSY-associated TM helix domain-containing protein [Arenibacter certesii]GGW46230.1 iron transporter [Arenibacter certesii]
MKKQVKTTRWIRIRKFLNDIHLWVGLISGLILLVVCFTGTLYVYNTEIREWSAPHLYKVAVPKEKEALPIETIIHKGRWVLQGNSTGIKISSDPARSLQIITKKEGDKGRFGTTYFFDPYTGNFLGDSKVDNAVNRFMGNIFSLHRWLLLDKIEKPLITGLENRTLGGYITGAATILFTIGVLTGLVIWIPRKVKYWGQGLKIKFRGNWKRINHDLHNTLAFYSAIILFLMGVTGPFWSFPWYREVMQKSLGTYKEQQVSKTSSNLENKSKKLLIEDSDVLPIAEYLSVVDSQLDYSGDYSISMPEKGGTEISISKKKIGFFSPAASDKIVLDVNTKEIKELEVFTAKPFNERVSSSIKALHIGDVYGSFTKLLYFISCLIATSLPITGTLIWINKMKKTKKKKK